MRVAVLVLYVALAAIAALVLWRLLNHEPLGF